MTVRVLVVDDNRGVREGLAKVLTLEGFQVTTAENGVAAFAEAQARPFDAIVLDIMMPVLDGMRLYEALATELPEAATRILFVSAWFDDPDVQRFLDRTGQPVLGKPFDIHELVRLIKTLAATEATATDNASGETRPATHDQQRSG